MEKKKNTIIIVLSIISILLIGLCTFIINNEPKCKDGVEKCEEALIDTELHSFEVLDASDIKNIVNDTDLKIEDNKLYINNNFATEVYDEYGFKVYHIDYLYFVRTTVGQCADRYNVYNSKAKIMNVIGDNTNENSIYDVYKIYLDEYGKINTLVEKDCSILDNSSTKKAIISINGDYVKVTYK